MSEEQIREKIEVYQAAFKELYDMAAKDLQRLRGTTQGQASESDMAELKERVREVMFGYRRDAQGKKV